MNKEYSAAEADVASGGRGLARLNPSPRKSYVITVKIDDAPGPFALIQSGAQYDVANRQECGRIIPATGRAGRMTSQEDVVLHKISSGEYSGTIYLDLMQDEDYFGRGVCRWEFVGVSVLLKATGAWEETRFTSFMDAETIVSGEPHTRFYAWAVYPRSKVVDDYPETGVGSVDDYIPEIRSNVFSLSMSAVEIKP